MADCGLIDGRRIASMWRRLGANTIDLLIIIGLQVLIAILFPNLPTGFLSWQRFLASTGVLLVYMTVSQVLTHNTIGKYILGIQVVNDHPIGGMPSFKRIVLRETVGRFLSMQLFFLGYFLAFRDPKLRAWSDRMADTVVTRRETDPSLQRGLVILVTVFSLGMCVLAGVSPVLRQNKAFQLMQIGLEAPSLDRLGMNIERLRRQGRTVSDLQQSNRQLLPVLDQFDKSLRRIQDRMRDLQPRKPTSPAAAGSVQAALEDFEILQKRSVVERQETWLILSQDPGTAIQKLQSDLAPLEAQITQLNRQLVSQRLQRLRNRARQK